MKKRPRIMVFRLKELIYTTIFILLGILLIVLMVYMFSSDKHSEASDKHTNSRPAETTSSEEIPPENTPSESTQPLPLESKPIQTANSTPSESDTDATSSVQEESLYIPGVYTSSLVLSNSSMEIQVCVDAAHINSVSIKNIDEAVSTMYPLMENSMNDISNQIVNSQSLENITYSPDSQYTYMILLDAIGTTINKAKITAAKSTN